MEITSYVLGMLTVGAVLMLITLITGMVKINKLEKQNSHHEKQFEQVYDNMCRYDNELRQSLDSTNRDISMIEKTIIDQIDQTRQEHNRDIYATRTDLSSYIDSRIDKVVAKETLKNSKQIIKG